MSDVKVYGVPYSSYTWSVRMALAEKGVDYELVMSPPNSKGQLKRHPFGKVPAFSHGDVEIFETVAILAYVDEVFEGVPLSPGNATGRAVMNQWVSAINDYLYPAAVSGVVIPRFVIQPQGGTVDEAAIAAAGARTREYLSIFDELLGQSGFVAGERLSLADIFLAPIGFYIGAVPEGPKLLDGFDNVQRFNGDMMSRASFKSGMPDFGG